MSKMTLIDTECAAENETGRVYGIRAEGEGFFYENKFVSMNKSCVRLLIDRIESNGVADEHIADIVSDFFCNCGRH